jgi:hypothetical protein
MSRSDSQTKPWKAAGVSRATWYRCHLAMGASGRSKNARNLTIRSMGTLRDQCAKVPRKCAKLRTSAPAPSHFNP